jgi:hypothetical protein
MTTSQESSSRRPEKWRRQHDQQWVVLSCMSAHPDNLEKAEALCFTEFLKDRFARFVNGEGFFTSRTRVLAPNPKLVINPPREVTEEEIQASKTGRMDSPEIPAEATTETTGSVVSATPEESGIEVFSFNADDLAAEYAQWKEIHAVNLHKMCKEKLGALPHTRAVIIHGCEPTREAAKRAAAYLSSLDDRYNYFTGPVGKPLLSDPVPELIEDHNYGNPDVDKIMKAYMQNRQDADASFRKLRDEQVAELARNNPGVFGEVHSRNTLESPYGM